ncbi:zinc-binding dehydrogenase [Streptomyces prasinopilosus]|uniref:zinc-binding dehydrogenase n=1 Tax=Streptomyces prasinopilosus TaxID=67344 RepID=UPI0006EB80D4|nr:zinc-binding dehydrogenase [Streptomyces prasinopilosus]
MKAIQVTAFGGPEALTVVEMPDPEPGPGQVLVDVAAVDVINLDTHVRTGAWKDFFPVPLPYVPGGAVAGTVTAVGTGVPGTRVGERVAAWLDGVSGGYAERAVADAASTAPVPDGVDLRSAAALMHDLPTALLLLDLAEIKPRDRVLITGAAGAMGLLLVRAAHAAGAVVVGAARGARKLELVREQGADAAVDYSAEGWVEAARTAAGGEFSVLLDGVGGELGTAALSAAGDGARISTHGAAAGGFARVDTEVVARRGQRVSGIAAVRIGPDRAGAVRRRWEEALRTRFAEFRPVIGQTFALEEAGIAHTAIEAREAPGKTLLIP